MRLLLTRPEPDAQRTAAALRSGGHDVVVAPFLRIEAIAEAQIGDGPWAAILITSANAARGRLETLHSVPVFAVGDRSAQAMRAAGFSDVTSAGGNAADLVRLTAARNAPGASLLYLAGEDRSSDLAGDLRALNFAVHTAVVYRAVTATDFPAAAADALAGEIAGVLHFSRRSATAYVDAARRAGLLATALKPAHFCLSTQVAEPLTHAGAAAVRIAEQPTEMALIDLIAPA